MIDTVIRKCSSETVAEKIVGPKNVMEKINKENRKKTKKYENSERNKMRSVAVYYGGGVMGKKKYRAVFRYSSYIREGSKFKRIIVGNSRIPKLVPYYKLMPFIKSIDIGKLYSVRDELCQGLPEHEKVSGVYRDLTELLLTLAKYYLSCRRKDLQWFGSAPHTFSIAIGGDGSPFMKYNTACAWVISFLNIDKGVLSSDENFLLFGANCSENCTPVHKFLDKINKEIQAIEKKTFSVTLPNDTVINDVKFVFSELPNDMKMLCFIAGEVSNSATYFSTFANVNKDEIADTNGTFSLDRNTKWKPWSYEKRLKDSDSVSKFKKSVAKKKVTEATKRNNITQHIASQSPRVCSITGETY